MHRIPFRSTTEMLLVTEKGVSYLHIAQLKGGF